jgi:para-nitrobenzyl esterase
VNRPWEPVDQQLANTMSDYWVNFIKTGDPNGKGLPAWPVYNTEQKMVMELGVKQGAMPLPDAASLHYLFQKMNAK